MAIQASKPATPEKVEPLVWGPSEGMTISTVRVQQLRDAFVAIEHPEGWTAEQLSAALARRSGDIASGTCWYDAAATTSVVEAVMGVNKPDEEYREPLGLTEADLSPAAPVAVVEEFTPAGEVA